MVNYGAGFSLRLAGPALHCGLRPFRFSLEMTMKTLFRSFVRDERGVTAIEYSLIAAGVAVAITTVVFQLGTQVSATFSSISTALSTGK